MRSTRRNRGSAFILVVGLMVTLAMVGSVFFFITRSDNTDAAAAAEAAPMRTVADSVLTAVRDALLHDLYIDGENGPYSAVQRFPPPIQRWQWRAYIDYPSPDPEDPFDRHLASTERAWADGRFVTKGHWPKISNLARYPAELVTDVDYDPEGVLGDGDPSNDHRTYVSVALIDPSLALVDTTGNDVPDAIPLVDADGDGVPDSILSPTGIFDRSGEQYYAAVRVIDLSGFVNVNTAFGLQVPDPAIPVTTGIPVSNVALYDIGRDYYDHDDEVFRIIPVDFPVAGVHGARCDDQPTHRWDWFTLDAALRPANPDMPNVDRQYRLYDWADELALRWRSLSPAMYNSRVFQAMLNIDNVRHDDMVDNADIVRYSAHLTTASASRLYPRPTEADSDWEMRPPAKVDLNLPLDGAVERRWAFHSYRRAFYGMLGGIGLPGSERRRMAAQLAVNLIDFRDDDDRPTVVYADEIPGVVSGTGYPVMGVERQPFISRVWLKVIPAPDPAPGEERDDPDWEMAIVLYNPYNRAIDLTDWEIQIAGTTETFGAGESIDAGGRYLIRSSAAVQEVPGFSGVIEIKGSSESDDVIIRRPGYRLDSLTQADDDVPVGIVRWDDHEIGDLKDTLHEGSHVDHFYMLSRDDSDNTYRVSLAVYTLEQDYGDDPSDVPDYTEDPVPATSNNVDPSAELSRFYGTMEFVPPTPVFVRGIEDGAFGVNPKRMTSVGELGRLFYFGPQGPYLPLDYVLADRLEPLTDDTRFRLMNLAVGRLNTFAFVDASDPYPEVPVICLAGDYFTVDSPLNDYDEFGNPIDNDGDGVANPDLNTDPEAWNRETVVHGRININTATLQALCALPMLADTDYDPLERTRMAADLIAYRDFLQPLEGLDNWDFNLPGSRSTVLRAVAGTYFGGGTLSVNLRGDRMPGFAAAGEAAMLMRARPPNPGMATYWTGSTPPTAYGYRLDADSGDDGYDRVLSDVGDLSKWELRYAYTGNLLSVNSDIYCAYIWVQLGPELNPTTKRRYIAIIDRSNCIHDTDQPLVRAFAEIK